MGIKSKAKGRVTIRHFFISILGSRVKIIFWSERKRTIANANKDNPEDMRDQVEKPNRKGRSRARKLNMTSSVTWIFLVAVAVNKTIMTATDTNCRSTAHACIYSSLIRIVL